MASKLSPTRHSQELLKVSSSIVGEWWEMEMTSPIVGEWGEMEMSGMVFHGACHLEASQTYVLKLSNSSHWKS